jgi:tyrosyl-tRNA synthetase
MKSEVQKQFDVIAKNTVEIIEEEKLKGKIEHSIAANSPLRIKYGIDPTSPEIHLGHTVVIRKLRDFQDLGHKILFLIGDFTARIGDPTGRNETRPILSEEEIRKNLATYQSQISGILDLDRVEFVYNADWLKKIALEKFIKIASAFTIAQILERDDFFTRYKAGKPIFYHEFMYPLLQGYDSVELKADVEIGATEQKFNLLAGRTLQEFFGQEKQIVITMPILVGTDGKMKMSKTYKNHIPISTTPKDMFGKVMSIRDDVMEAYFQLLTQLPPDSWRELIGKDPRQAKGLLAGTIVGGFFGTEAARAAEEEFDRIFKEKQTPDEIPEIVLAESALTDGRINVLAVLTAVDPSLSKAEAKRLIAQKAVKIDGNLVESLDEQIAPDRKIVKIGKRRFGKIRVSRFTQ